jgi:peptidoglycan/LPS O-acetylase OafA/YrhL
MMIQQTARTNLTALTGIRFLAALIVVSHHFGSLAPYPFAQNIAEAGFSGVSLFYILSGFIMIYTYDGKFEESGFTKRFLIARIARIYPVYALSMLISAPLYFFALSDRNSLYTFIGKALVVTTSRITLTHAWVDFLVPFWNNPSWSLSAEWFFYLLFSAPLARSLAKRWPLGLSATILLLIAAMLGIGWIQLQLSPYVWEHFLYPNPLLHTPQFILGVCLGKFWISRHSSPVWWVSDLCFLLTIAVLSLAYLVPRQLLQFGGLSFVFAPLILFLASGQGIFAKLLSSRVFVFLGEASYGMYILHWPIWEIFSLYCQTHGYCFDGYLHFWTYIAIVIGISSLSFRYFESPARYYLRRWLLMRIA